MTSILQLSPPIPIVSPKGDGMALVLIDYGVDYDLMWVVAINDTGEFWTFNNSKVRAVKNITIERIYDSPE